MILYRCTDCSLMYAVPAPEELPEYCTACHYQDGGDWAMRVHAVDFGKGETAI